jgi:N-acetylmuramoyl-L-alanine amidase
MRTLREIIVHCSATAPDNDVGVTEIRRWHLDRGWADIGYHFVIRRGGVVEAGRAVARVGAHVRGRNQASIGVCLVGGVTADGVADANFTLGQYRALETLVADLHERYGALAVLGHRDTGAKKACPCFDVGALLGVA